MSTKIGEGPTQGHNQGSNAASKLDQLSIRRDRIADQTVEASSPTTVKEAELTSSNFSSQSSKQRELLYAARKRHRISQANETLPKSELKKASLRNPKASQNKKADWFNAWKNFWANSEMLPERLIKFIDKILKAIVDFILRPLEKTETLEPPAVKISDLDPKARKKKRKRKKDLEFEGQLPKFD